MLNLEENKPKTPEEKKDDIDKIINKQMMSFSDKVDHIFNKIGFLELE